MTDSKDANLALDRLVEKISKVIADIRDTHPSIDPAFVADALRETITANAIVFPNSMGRRFAQATLDREYEHYTLMSRVDTILGLDGHAPARSGQVIELGDDGFVVEIINALGERDRILWSVVLDGVHLTRLFETKSAALLGYLEAKNNNGKVDYSTHTAAARVLRIEA